MTKLQAQLVADYVCHTGENPLWHPLEQRLYWTDIPTGRLFRYDPLHETHEQIYTGRCVGGFTFHRGGGLLLFQDKGSVAIWHEGLITECLSGIERETSSRFNDVIASPSGRVFCGTMSSQAGLGKLYRLDPDGTLRVVLEEIGISNGMAFSNDLSRFFYTDSSAGEIYQFDYQDETGSLKNKRLFTRIPPSEGLPDGCTMDTSDHLWSALWDGGCVVRFSPDGTIDYRISIPAPKTSSLTFGGRNLSDLYVTTAGGHDRDVEGQGAGALFRLQGIEGGKAEFFSMLYQPRIVVI